MNYQILQSQYDEIYSFFGGTTESFDYLEWDGNFLTIWLRDRMIEKYSAQDLSCMLEKVD